MLHTVCFRALKNSWAQFQAYSIFLLTMRARPHEGFVDWLTGGALDTRVHFACLMLTK